MTVLTRMTTTGIPFILTLLVSSQFVYKKEKGKAGKADILALKGFKEYKLHISITPHLKAKELYFLEKKTFTMSILLTQHRVKVFFFCSRCRNKDVQQCFQKLKHIVHTKCSRSEISYQSASVLTFTLIFRC